MNNFLNKKVLLLNSSYEPLMAINTKRAIILSFLKKVDTISNSNNIVHSEKIDFKVPSVVKLKTYTFVKRNTISLTRKNVFLRDNNTCQYCGKNDCLLTIDHIVPKDKGGKDTWNNLVASCNRCNRKKSNLPLEKIGMTLMKKPVKPHYLLYLQKYALNEYSNWKPYLFMD